MYAKFMFFAVTVVLVEAWANQAPRAQISVIHALPNQPVEVVLGATDPDGDPLEFELLDPPEGGTLLGAPPRFTYWPSPGFTGSLRFSFRVRDPYGAFDVGWVEIRVNEKAQSLRIFPKAPTNSTLLGLTAFLVDQGVKTWYVAELEPRSFPPGLLPFLFVGGSGGAHALMIGPAEEPGWQDLGEVRGPVIWVDMRTAKPGLYFFLVVSGESAFTYPVRLVHPLQDRKFAFAG